MVEWKQLGDCIISLKTGLNPRKNFVLNSEGSTNYYITVRELDYWKINPSDKTDKVDDNAIKIINNRSNLEEGDVLFSGTGTIGRTALVNETPKNWNIKEGVYTIKPKKDVLNSKFLIELFHSYYLINKINEYTVGDPIRSVPMKNLVQIQIPIPDIIEQERIVDILDTFTSSIDNLKQQIAQRRKQFEHYRDQLLDLEGKEGVEMKTLGEVCGIYDGTHQTPNYKDFGIKFVSVENIKDVYSSCKYISIEDYQNNYKTKPQKGDVLMTRIGDVGSCAVIDRDEPIAYYVSLALLRPSTDLVLSNYVKYILESKTGKIELRKRTLLTAVPLKINLGDIGKIKLPFPSLSEQQRIVSILDTFEASIQNLESQLSQREKQYEYYRNKLLTFE